jgi:hypothetical protein
VVSSLVFGSIVPVLEASGRNVVPKNRHDPLVIWAPVPWSTLTTDQGQPGLGIFRSQDFFPLGFLQFSEFESWNEVANWATKLFEAKATANDELRAVLKKIRALNSNEARVSAALEFV